MASGADTAGTDTDGPTVGIRYSGMKDVYRTESSGCQDSDTRLYLVDDELVRAPVFHSYYR
jgi:hypothetical protein